MGSKPQHAYPTVFPKPMRIYVDPISESSRCIVVLARLLQMPVDVQSISIKRGEHRTPELLAKNPLGKVPFLLEHDGFCVPEACAILTFLARRFQVPDAWYPSDLRGNTRLDTALHWQQRTLLHSLKTSLNNSNPNLEYFATLTTAELPRRSPTRGTPLRGNTRLDTALHWQQRTLLHSLNTSVNNSNPNLEYFLTPTTLKVPDAWYPSDLRDNTRLDTALHWQQRMLLHSIKTSINNSNPNLESFLTPTTPKVPDAWYPSDLRGKTRVDTALHWQQRTLRANTDRLLSERVVKPAAAAAAAAAGGGALLHAQGGPGGGGGGVRISAHGSVCVEGMTEAERGLLEAMSQLEHVWLAPNSRREAAPPQGGQQAQQGGQQGGQQGAQQAGQGGQQAGQQGGQPCSAASADTAATAAPSAAAAGSRGGSPPQQQQQQQHGVPACSSSDGGGSGAAAAAGAGAPAAPPSMPSASAAAPSDFCFMGGAAVPSLADLLCACIVEQLRLLDTVVSCDAAARRKPDYADVLGRFPRVRAWAARVEAACAPHFTDVHATLRSGVARAQTLGAAALGAAAAGAAQMSGAGRPQSAAPGTAASGPAGAAQTSGGDGGGGATAGAGGAPTAAALGTAAGVRGGGGGHALYHAAPPPPPPGPGGAAPGQGAPARTHSPTATAAAAGPAATATNGAAAANGASAAAAAAAAHPGALDAPSMRSAPALARPQPTQALLHLLSVVGGAGAAQAFAAGGGVLQGGAGAQPGADKASGVSGGGGSAPGGGGGASGGPGAPPARAALSFTPSFPVLPSAPGARPTTLLREIFNGEPPAVTAAAGKASSTASAGWQVPTKPAVMINGHGGSSSHSVPRAQASSAVNVPPGNSGGGGGAAGGGVGSARSSSPTA
ncbi:hypothetical protein FOA52_013910 [Chlamydomonas sp. UWO 241]|nr:hypothetical protein FOA52_013910 [Chlamydomonas sp. UWO 241]